MDAPPRSRSRRPYGVAALLMGLPALALLAIPAYAHVEPVIAGLPMFYWWTFLWIALLSAGTAASYRLIEKAKAGEPR